MEQGYGNVYISDLALPEAKTVRSRWSQLKGNFKMKKDKQQPRPTKRNKVRVVSARFTDIEYQAVEKRRKDAGVSLSRFVHSVLLTGKVVQRISKADADVLRKLAGEANNINQLAHKANAGGFAGVAAELMMLKKKIVQIIKQLSDDWKNK
ncbi:uncharacterized protein BN659_01364 [Bacteroides sp. CAG:443]|jgi:hypothetical protein|nr:uncharacterized protein BN659_01364 [Bacteroides sp. CAG:443]